MAATTGPSYSAGIDFGGTFTKLALVAADGAILDHRRMATAAGKEPLQALAEVRAVLESMASAAGLPYPPPGGCGIGIPSLINHRAGWLILSGPLGWRDVPLGQLSRQALGCETAVDDDVAAGALADFYFGSARDARNMLYVSWGTGIGAGLIVDRRLYRSRGGAMYELGHMPADPSSTRLCYCGCRGCLEIEAGGKAMVEKASEALRRGTASILREVSELTPRHIARAAAAGDPLACRVVEAAAVLMARVLAGALALLNPDTVVFAGGVSNCLPVIQSVFDAELHRRAPAFSLRDTRILRSSFGDSAGVVGAACLPRNRREEERR